MQPELPSSAGPSGGIDDPVALLRVWPVTVFLGEVQYRIEARPAADWAEAILSGDAMAIVPGLFDGAAEQDVILGLMAGDISVDNISEAAHDAIAAAAGRPWWEAHRLVASAAAQADFILGGLINQGFDFESRSLGALCSAIVQLVTRRMDKKELLKFDMTLRTPPAEIIKDDEEYLAEAFLKAMNER